ncbi:Serine/threonine protein kinase [methanotrophic endosymbiont of Bathymodiolus azoricus (Menez Gwen)]|nr:Serine/threonine protein kinase [methanotrophic endosymbiont of Bathymodiolus azoricus (Menez Gwen)]
MTAVGIKFLPPSRTAIAAHFGLANFPVAYCGLKIITSLSLRFPDFQRDFGATKVAGIEEISSPIKHANRLGTAQYTAPEYMLGELGSSRSDLFSLGVITYQMLTGKLPYGTQVAKTTTKAEQKN